MRNGRITGRVFIQISGSHTGSWPFSSDISPGWMIPFWCTVPSGTVVGGLLYEILIGPGNIVHQLLIL